MRESGDGITITKNINQTGIKISPKLLMGFPFILIFIDYIDNVFALCEKSSLKVGWRAELFRRYLELAQFTYGCHVGSGCKYLNTRIRPHSVIIMTSLSKVKHLHEIQLLIRDYKINMRHYRNLYLYNGV